MEKDVLSQYREAIGYSIEELYEKVLQISKLNSTNPTIIRRVKDLDTLVKKMTLKQASSVLEIEDVYGFCILVSDTNEIYEVMRAVMGVFDSYIDHDYIKTPKTRSDKPHLKGKSLRLLQLIAYANNVPFEVQITTHVFNEENEKLHEEYHSEKYS